MRRGMRSLQPAIFLAGMLLTLLAACGPPEATPSPAPTLAPGAPTPTPAPTSVEPAPTPAPAFDADAYFRGKTIRLITSSNPGGGTDTYLRYIASAGQKFFPGSPRLIVSNVPPHVVGKNFIWGAPPDGLTIFLSANSMLTEEAHSGAQWDSSRLTYIGDVGVTTTVFVIRGNLPYQDVRDAMGASEPMIRTMAPPQDPGAVASSVLEQMLIAHFLELPFEMVRTAEDGTGPSLLAFERGDINGYRYASGGWLLIPRARSGWFEEGYLRPFYWATIGRTWLPNEVYPEPTVPHVYDLFTEEQREIFTGLVEARTNQIRPVSMPPDVPSEITAVLRQAFDAMFHDQEFCAGLDRVAGAPCAWVDGDETQRRAVEGQAAIARWEGEYDTWSTQMHDKYMR